MKRIFVFALACGVLLGCGTLLWAQPPPTPGPRPSGTGPPVVGTQAPPRPVVKIPLPPAPPAEGAEGPIPPGGMKPHGEIPSLEAAQRAVDSAGRAVRFLKAGRIWFRRGPVGDLVARAAMFYRGRCVAVLEFDPATGRPLPVGNRPFRFERGKGAAEIATRLSRVVSGLVALKGAEYRERESLWAVPLAYRGAIVSHLNVSADGKRIVPDYPAEQEMRAYGR